jgi:hypothetical protein
MGMLHGSADAGLLAMLMFIGRTYPNSGGVARPLHDHLDSIAQRIGAAFIPHAGMIQ